MGHTGPSQVVQAPMAAAPTFGLIVSSSKPDPEDVVDSHWQNGITYEPEGCQIGQTVDPCAPDSVIYPTHPATASWNPYGIIAMEVCSTFSLREERLARVERLINMDTERQLGRELWTGVTSQDATIDHPTNPWPNTWLADPINLVELSTGVGIDPIDALGCLENYLAHHNGGQRGMIHTTAHVLQHWLKNYLVMRQGDLLVTPLGTIVVVSPGYTGTDPDGNIATNNVWAYATDMVRVWLSSPQTFDLEHTIDRRQNTVQTQANRVGLAEWERCRHAGVQVAVPHCPGEGS